MTTPDTEKRAPVQGYPGGIPWAIHLEAYEVYCKRYGAQPALIDLEGRNCRGGFGTGELDAFIPGWRDRVAEFGLLKTEVAQLRARVAELEELLRSACAIADRSGLDTAWDLFGDSVRRLGLNGITARVYRAESRTVAHHPV